MKKIRKAVIPAAGFGTRFLPFTKAVPKELIPLVDKPVIQYVVEEAVAAGIEEILIITSSGKEAIQHHFNPAFELEARLTATGKEALRDELRAINNLAEIHYLHQQELNGLGDAVRLARSFAAGEGFAVLLGDTVLHSDSRPVTGQLIEAALELDAPVTALETVPWERVSRYGVIAGKARMGVSTGSTALWKNLPGKRPPAIWWSPPGMFSPRRSSTCSTAPRAARATKSSSPTPCACCSKTADVRTADRWTPLRHRQQTRVSDRNRRIRTAASGIFRRFRRLSQGSC